MPMVKMNVAVKMSNGKNSTWIYSKECGHETCNSVCFGEENVAECRGEIPASEFTAPHTVGDTNSLGDMYSSTPFRSYDPSSWSVPEGVSLGHYWRRCAHDMTIGPSETVRTLPSNGGDGNKGLLGHCIAVYG